MGPCHPSRFAQRHRTTCPAQEACVVMGGEQISWHVVGVWVAGHVEQVMVWCVLECGGV